MAEKVGKQMRLSSRFTICEYGCKFPGGTLFRAGLSYRDKCVVRSALSSVLECKDCEQFGQHKWARQFTKGFFEKRPAFPKYSSAWDIDIAFKYLESFYPHEKLIMEGALLQIRYASGLAVWTAVSDSTQFISAFTKIIWFLVLVHCECTVQTVSKKKAFSTSRISGFPSERQAVCGVCTERVPQ